MPSGYHSMVMRVEYEDADAPVVNPTLDLNIAGINVWSIEEAPEYNVSFVVEYGNIPSPPQKYDFTVAGINVYSLYEEFYDNKKMVVEYEDILQPPKKYDFTENAIGNWRLDEEFYIDMKMEVEYEEKYGFAEKGINIYGLYEEFYSDMKMVVEYEDIPQLSLDFVDNGDDTWTLDEAPGFNTKMVVEYESVLPEIALLDNADNSTVLTDNEGLLVDATLQDRTLYKDGKWNTLCLPFDVPSLTGTPLEGATIMELNTTKKNGFDAHEGTLYLTFKTVTATEAGKPYLLKLENGTDMVEPVFTSVTIANTTPVAIDAQSSGLDKVQMVGNYAPLNVKANDPSILFMGDGSSLYYTTEDRTLRNFRAHFIIPNASALAPARGFVLDFDGEEVTSINGIAAEEGSKADEWYSLDGRKLGGEPTAKGVYIHGGRKVVIP